MTMDTSANGKKRVVRPAALSDRWEREQLLIINTSGLARLTGLDRGTIVKRLAAAKVRPLRRTKNQTDWNFDEAMSALRMPDGLREEQRQQISINRQIAELKLQQMSKDLLPRADVLEELTRVLSFPYQELRRTRRREFVTEIRRSKNLRDAECTFGLMVDKLFQDLKTNYQRALMTA